MRRILVILFLIFTVLTAGFSQESGDDMNNDGKIDRWVRINGGIVDKVSFDRDFDGSVDYIIFYTEESEKKEEQLDFNYDGSMDDFYYYAAGKMKRREIDTNFDGMIDIWVYLDGIYIQKYEKDIDFDGKIDITKELIEE